MDANTKDVLFLVVPLIGTIVTGWLALKMQQVKGKQDALATDMSVVRGQQNADGVKLDLVAKGVDGLTTKLVDAKASEATLIATAAEKVAQADRENQQAKGAAAARQADAGAKVTTPPTMAVPSTAPPPKETP